jgi:hypothetical protein
MAFEFNSATYAMQLSEELGESYNGYGLWPESVHVIFGTDEAGGDSTLTTMSIWAPSIGMQLEYYEDQFDYEKEYGMLDLGGAGYFRFDFRGTIELDAFMENLELLVEKYREHREEIRKKYAADDDDLIMEE